MIPEFAIREWSEHVPWTESEQIEQDLLICRALTERYKDEYLASHLAFRGGLHYTSCFSRPNPGTAKILTWYRLTLSLSKKPMTV